MYCGMHDAYLFIYIYTSICVEFILYDIDIFEETYCIYMRLYVCVQHVVTARW